ncbi:SCP2 sterol-binding domain-containing protein [Micromonospora halophytica]|uniref:SCP-2 sterol transfer family protein n=1 Tax=Micromonospora halophytica TaxID=47864 RepID=A0A1C5I765_9ACTN|nr:SCP2 sterol-binding domain-containing protein [Micromonospora halophytica]SCG54174.1 SCP-2 sterol transfer family protein [Micromonospora halophytica]
MSASIEEFLGELADCPYLQRLARVDGTVRLDLTEDGQIHHWHITITSGKITLSRENRPADCVLHGDKALLDAAARGERNLTTAWLTRNLVLEGRVELFRLLERLFPGPPAARNPRDLVLPPPGGQS